MICRTCMLAYKYNHAINHNLTHYLEQMQIQKNTDFHDDKKRHPNIKLKKKMLHIVNAGMKRNWRNRKLGGNMACTILFNLSLI